MALAPLSFVRPFSIVSWNILHPEFCTSKKYRFCDSQYLDWDFRRQTIVETLNILTPDVICLQEVPRDRFASEILEPLEEQYLGIVQNVTRGHTVACATLIRRETLCVQSIESRSRALIVGLSNEAGHRLILANVHLEAGMDQDEKRYYQIRSLLKRLRLHRTDAESNHVLITGDFNMLRSNPIYSYLKTGKPQTIHGSASIFTTKSSELLPLTDVFRNSGLKRTFVGGCILDYMFVNDDLQVEPWILSSKGPAGSWPSRSHPSDHEPIGAHVSFSKRYRKKHQ